eukprot:365630-Chlamydomonas_euryale.AAC.19
MQREEGQGHRQAMVGNVEKGHGIAPHLRLACNTLLALLRATHNGDNADRLAGQRDLGYGHHVVDVAVVVRIRVRPAFARAPCARAGAPAAAVTARGAALARGFKEEVLERRHGAGAAAENAGDLRVHAAPAPQLCNALGRVRLGDGHSVAWRALVVHDGLRGRGEQVLRRPGRPMCGGVGEAADDGAEASLRPHALHVDRCRVRWASDGRRALLDAALQPIWQPGQRP